MSYVIETNKLVKCYGSLAAVDGVSMHVRRGEIYGLIGKNGAGKTTLMKLLLGHTFKNSGEIRLFESGDLDAGRRRIGSLVEMPALYTGESAYANLKHFAYLTNSPDSEIQAILNMVGLAGVGSKKVGEFSLGMKQRLGIGIALLGRPDVLILDEPVNGLDPAGIRAVRDMILDLNSRGVTFLISSHLLDELGKIATRYGVMRGGSLVRELTPDEIPKDTAPIDITVDSPAAAKLVIEDAYPEATVTEVPNGVRVTYKENIEPADINTILVNGGFKVYEIKREQFVMEDFFIKLMQ